MVWPAVEYNKILTRLPSPLQATWNPAARRTASTEEMRKDPAGYCVVMDCTDTVVWTPPTGTLFVRLTGRQAVPPGAVEPSHGPSRRASGSCMFRICLLYTSPSPRDS